MFSSRFFSSSKFKLNWSFALKLLFVLITTGTVKSAEVVKGFTPNNIDSGTVVTLNIGFVNSSGSSLTGGNLTDNLPSNASGQITVANPANIRNNTCGNGTTTGVITATPGTAIVSISNATIPVSAIPGVPGCSFDVDVLGQATSAVALNNQIPTHALTFSPANPSQENLTVINQSLTIAAITPPSVAMSLTPKSTVVVGESTNLRVNVTNGSTASNLTNTNWVMDLPAGVKIFGAPSVVSGCGGGATITGTVGAQHISFSGGTIALNGGVCIVNIPIYSDTAGTYSNITLPANAIQDTQLATKNTPTTAPSLAVQTLSASKRFTTGGGATITTIEVGVPFRVEVSVTNTGNITYTGLSIADKFTADGNTLTNLKLTNPAAPVYTATGCGAGHSVAQIAGNTGFTFSNGTLSPAVFPATTTCVVSVEVIATGTFASTTNNIPTTNIATTAPAVVNPYQALTANMAATAFLATNATVAKAFTAPTIAAGATGQFTITITNNSTVNFANLAINDALPTASGGAMSVNSVVGNTCNTTGGTPLAGATAIALTGGTLAAGASCVVTIAVNAPNLTAGNVVYTNNANIAYTHYTGQVGTDTRISSNTNLTVTPLTFTASKAFSGTTVAKTVVAGDGQTPTLTLTLTNSSGVPFTSLTVNDVLPNGMNVASFVSNSCGTTTDPAPGNTTINLTGGSLANGASCQVVVTVNAPNPNSGVDLSDVNNATFGFNYYAGQTTPTTTTVTDTLTVNRVPFTITKAFTAPKSIAVNDNNQVTITIVNSSGANFTSLAINDQAAGNLVAGLTIPSANIDSSTGCGALTNASTVNRLILTGGTLAAGGTCTVTFTVKGTTAGAKVNNAGTSFNFYAGQTVLTTKTSANDTLNVSDFTATKSFDLANIPVGVTTTMRVTIYNWSTTVARTNIGFSDNIPGANRVVIATPSNVTNTCGGAVTAVSGTTDTLTLAGGSLPVAPSAGVPSSCIVTVDITGATANALQTNTMPVTSTQGNVLQNPSATFTVSTLTSGYFSTNSKVFLPTSILPNHVSQATVDWRYNQNLAGNPANPASANATIVDHLPVGTTVATPDNTVVQCEMGTNGTYVTLTGVTTPSLGSVTISPLRDSITVAINGQLSGGSRDCRMRFDVTGSAVGVYTNIISPSDITTTTATVNGGTNTVSAPLTITTNIGFNPVTKTFTPNSIASGTTSQVAVTWTNNAPANVTAAASTATNVDFTDNLPLNLTVAATPNALYNCGGADIAVPVPNITIPVARDKITVRLPVSQARTIACTVKFDVTSSVAAVYPNTIAIGDIVSFDDPAFKNYAASPTVNLTVVGNIDFTAVTKAFSPTSIVPGFISTVSLTWKNNAALGTAAVTNVQVVDNLPVNVTLAALPRASYSCGAVVGPPAAPAVPALTPLTSISLVGQQLKLVIPSQAAQQTCTIVFDVTSNVLNAGYLNNIAIGGITSLDNPIYTNPAASANATLAVVNTIGFNAVNKTFTPANIKAGQISQVAISFTNNAPVGSAPATNVDVTDGLPANITVAPTANALYNCGGGDIAVPAPFISAGRDVITVRIPSIARTVSCTVKFDVTSNVAGGWDNTIPIGNIVSADYPDFKNIVASPTRTLTVSGDIGVTKSFSEHNLGDGAVTQLTIELTNPETINLTGVTFTDTLPGAAVPQLLIAPTPNANTNCGSGTVTAVAGTRNITLNNGTIPAQFGGVDGRCIITVDVTANFGATVSGSLTNTIAVNDVSSTNVPPRRNSVAASDTVTIVAPTITVSKSFVPNSVAGRAASRLTINIQNPQLFQQTDISFDDNMTNAGNGALPPNSILVSATPNASSTCGTAADWSFSKVGGGALTGGETKFHFSGGKVPAKAAGVNGSCFVYIDVIPQLEGSYTNLIPANSITTANGSKNATDVTGSLTSVAGVSITKAFTPNPAFIGDVVRLIITIGNSSLSTDFANGAFTDTFPGGLTLSGTPNIVTTCPSASITTTANSISMTGGIIPHNSSCTIEVTLDILDTCDYNNTIPWHNLSANDPSLNVYYNEYPGDATAQVRPSIKVVKQLVPVTDPGRFDFTLSPSAFSGPSARTNVGHDATPSAVTPFFVNGNTPYTITETGNGLTSLGDYNTTYECRDASGTLVSTTGTALAFTVTPPAACTGKSKSVQAITCTVTNTNKSYVAGLPLTINKTTFGGIGSFDFTVVNGATTLPVVTVATTIPGTQVASAEQTLPNVGSPVTVTETPLPSGWAVTSASCTETTTATGVAVSYTGTNAVTLPPIAAGKTYVCNFTNTKTGSAITGNVFKDTGTGAGTANNGTKDGTEVGIPQTTVKLTNCAGTTYSTTTTDVSGNYSLSTLNVPAGSVCIEEMNLPSYISTGGNATAGGTYDRTTDKITFTLVANTSYSGMNFADVPANRLLTDGAKTGRPGSTLTYPHIFIAGSGGTVTFSLPSTTASPPLAGWSEVLYTDKNCDGVLNTNPTPVPPEGADVKTSAGAITVAEGDKICLIQQEFIPAGAPMGASNLVKVQASFVYTNSLPLPVLTASYTRQDVTKVTDQALELLKMVRVDGTTDWLMTNTAKSGQTLEYQITYTNHGATPIKSLVVNDATPVYTTFVSALAGAFPANLTACQKITPSSGGSIPCADPDTATGTGAIKWTFTGSLAPGASGAVTFKVKVD
jgi:uncharacterized repeat protein (TIGR01451 family)